MSGKRWGDDGVKDAAGAARATDGRRGGGRAGAPRVRLGPGALPRPEPRAWHGDAAGLLADLGAGTATGTVRVVGGAGTGKTALLADAAVAALLRPGTRPDSVLVLAPDRPAARRLADDVVARLLVARGEETSEEPQVRTPHAYAWGILRDQARAAGNPPPRLISGPDHDAIVRELLAGRLEDGAPEWPAELRPSLGMVSFARDLRDLMQRAQERGLAPEEIAEIGRRAGRPEWIAAGRFAAEFEQTLLLRTTVGMQAPDASVAALDVAGLVGAAVDALYLDDDLLRAERGRIRTLLVDDAQHLDPLTARLVDIVAEGAAVTVLAGDPDQSVFGWRGAGVGGGEQAGRRIVLDLAHRLGTGGVAVAARIAERLPGTHESRGARAGGGTDEVAVRVFASSGAEAAAIADLLRRAHLVDGVPWSRMAVIVRSVAQHEVVLRRALQAAHVPMVAAAADEPPAARAVVAAMLAAVDAVVGRLDPTHLPELLAGPVGGVDMLAVDRLRRGLRRAETAAGGDRDGIELLAVAVLGEEVPAALTEVETRPVLRARAVLARIREALVPGAPVHDVMWAVWMALDTQNSLLWRSLRGGVLGAQADADLDAVMALMDEAESYDDTVPGATPQRFVEHLRAQVLAPRERPRLGGSPEAVEILSAHAATGREWDVVAVAGVQEGLWPSLRARGGVLRTPDFVDLLDGDRAEGEGDAVPRASQAAALLAEERRLFLVACTRARRRLLISAVEALEGDEELGASRFLDGLAAALDPDTGEDVTSGPAGTDDLPAVESTGTVLALPHLVAELRARASAADADPGERDEAIRQLGRLAADGVPGADPAEWWGLATVTERTEGHDAGAGPLRLSPSSLEKLLQCPLRWFLDSCAAGTRAETPAHMLDGSIVHAAAQALAGGMSSGEILAAIRWRWRRLIADDGWDSERRLAAIEEMLATFRAWVEDRRAEFDLVGAELAVEADLGNGVQLVGRMDRLERDRDGGLVIIDIKTGGTAVAKDRVEEHAQLAAYQVAVTHGRVRGAEVEAGTPVSGARLVYPRLDVVRRGVPEELLELSRKRAGERCQEAFDEETGREWRQRIMTAAADAGGPGYVARLGTHCTHCPYTHMCPLQDAGRPVTR